MTGKEIIGGLREPYVLEKNSTIYKHVRDAINNEKEEGVTPADMKEVNPQIALFMEANNIIKVKAKMDLIEKSDLSLETFRKLVALADQIKKENTED